MLNKGQGQRGGSGGGGAYAKTRVSRNPFQATPGNISRTHAIQESITGEGRSHTPYNMLRIEPTSFHRLHVVCQQCHPLRNGEAGGRSVVPVEHFGFGSKDGLVDLEEAVPGLLEDVDTGTAFGTLHHLCVVPEMSGTPARFERTSVPLGTHPAEW